MFDSERFDFRIISVLRVRMPRSSRFVAGRDYNVLSYRCAGCADIIHDGDSRRLEVGDITYVPSGYEYTINSPAEEDVIVVHFEINNRPPYAFEVHHASPEKRASYLFEQLLKNWYEKPIGAVYRCDSLFLSILEDIEIQTHDINSEREAGIRPIIEYMHRNFADETLSIEALADKAGYSPAYFRRIFREVSGMSPKQYLSRLRIDYATELLKCGYYRVEEVAAQCGFVCPKYFSTVYRTLTGRSPSTVRDDG